MVTLWAPRSVGELAWETLRLYRRAAGAWLVVTAVVQLPVAVLAAVLSHHAAVAGAPLLWSLVTLVVGALGFALLAGAFAVLLGDAVLGRGASVGRAFGVLARRARGLFGTTLLAVAGVLAVFAVCLLGVILVVFAVLIAVALVSRRGAPAGGSIPIAMPVFAAGGGLVFGIATAVLVLAVLVRWGFVFAVVVLEGQTGIGALRRSAALVQGTWGRVFGCYFALATPSTAVGAAGAALLRALPGPVWLAPLGGAVASLPLDAFMYAGIILLYLDLRIRQERLTPADLAATLPAVEGTSRCK